MPAPVPIPGSLSRYLARRPGATIGRIHAEASRRSFYRITRGENSLVAMVYPEPARAEVERFCAIRKLYRNHGLRVPRIDRVLDDQVVLQEDLGDLLLQKAWRTFGAGRRRRVLEQCREILARLAAVPPIQASSRLDRTRQQWEMDFFIRHFHPRFRSRAISETGLRSELRQLLRMIPPEDTFAHRDFHSRNLLVVGQEIALVDFQDSLVAPRHYDLVSLAFDSYLDLGPERGKLFCNLAACGDDSELRQVRLTALQRNIKALGTFAFQVFERRHRVYARYIPRTLRHIRGHLSVLANPELGILSTYFSKLS